MEALHKQVRISCWYTGERLLLDIIPLYDGLEGLLLLNPGYAVFTAPDER